MWGIGALSGHHMGVHVVEGLGGTRYGGCQDFRPFWVPHVNAPDRVP